MGTLRVDFIVALAFDTQYCILKYYFFGNNVVSRSIKSDLELEFWCCQTSLDTESWAQHSIMRPEIAMSVTNNNCKHIYNNIIIFLFNFLKVNFIISGYELSILQLRVVMSKSWTQLIGFKINRRRVINFSRWWESMRINGITEWTEVFKN